VQLHADFSIRPDAMAIWASKACAPLAARGKVVEQVRAGLIARLPALGHAIRHDPRLVVVADGMVLPAQTCGDWHCFVVPDGVAEIRLVSRTARPAELNPASEDWRCLGVAVTAIRIDGADVALDDAALTTGWLAGEAGLRWTGGDAVLQVRAGAVLELCSPVFLDYLEDSPQRAPGAGLAGAATPGVA
jgi:hypothetical protein